MKTNLKERSNAAICMRVNELCGTGMKVMDIYAKVGEEFWLEESTIANIVSKSGYYKNDF